MSNTLRLPADEIGIARAAALLREGHQVAFPTETVYGLGADATNEAAVAGIYTAKGRPSFNPLIVHIAEAEDAARYAELTPAAEKVAGFWPGPLTLVLPLRNDAGIALRVTAGHQSIALRLPGHPLARSLLRATGRPLAAPSANPSGRISPTTADHVMTGLSGKIAAVIDGGPCPVGLESTILDLTNTPRLLRAGGVPVEAIEDALGSKLAAEELTDNVAPLAPGMLSSHYAPRAELRLNADVPTKGETRLGFGSGPEPWTLSASGDLEEAAANLFTSLHEMDAAGITAIAVAPIPDRGLGRAINDRLRRAAVPRP